MDEERGRTRDPIDDLFDGVRSVTGVLGALAEALDRSLDELRESGELSPERARAAARATVKKAQETVEQLRERIEFVTRREFEALRDEVAALRRDVAALSAAPESAPDRPGEGKE